MHVHPRCDCSLDRGYSRPTEGVPVERQQTGLQRAREGLRATSAVVDLSEVGKMRSVWHCGMLTRNNFSCCRGGIAGDAVAIKTWPRTEAPQSCLNVCPSSAVQGRHSPFLPKRVSFSPPCAYFYPSRLGCVMCTCLCQASQQNWARVVALSEEGYGVRIRASCPTAGLLEGDLLGQGRRAETFSLRFPRTATMAAGWL